MGRQKLKRNDEKSRTIAMVCEMIEPFDAKVNHPWRLSDCLLFKFNLINKRQVRPNIRRAAEEPHHE